MLIWLFIPLLTSRNPNIHLFHIPPLSIISVFRKIHQQYSKLLFLPSSSLCIFLMLFDPTCITYLDEVSAHTGKPRPRKGGILWKRNNCNG
ncbi:BgTH12-00858 [Blumeria graminis f. sp. triticale]|uniref:BgTH12-00858 n=1 Tax=Blumeria graminis f. sp. triticale TaxID=1689686 RepID=A0A9W4DBG2_BLUGR|nr:BgTH12-00858 [Blumeria graminis f. sp. triticale]